MMARAWLVSIAMGVGSVGGGCASGPERGESEEAIAGPAPDYVVSAVGDPPATAVAGQAFSLTVTVLNQGTAAATATSTTRYFLSLDTVVGGDRAFTATTAVSALAVGESHVRSVALTIPGAPPGSYHVIACADRNAVIPELDNKNNCRASTGTVSLQSPDLVIDSLADPPPLLVPYAGFEIAETTRNVGTAPAVASKVAYFLSSTPTRDAGSHRLQPSRAVGALGAGEASTGSVSTYVPPLAPGAYYLVACADFERRVVEADEQNCRAAAGTLTVPVADLVVAALLEPPPAATAGDVLELSATTVNVGTLAAGVSSTRFFLSADAQPGDDLPVVGGQFVAPLAAGEARAVTTRIGIPHTTATGSYFVIACADAAGRILEQSEDNCRASSGPVVITQAAAAALVTVQLLDDWFYGEPGPGQPVLAHDAAGVQVARVATDASGAAQILVPAGGSMTVVALAPHELTTFYGLEDGDHLVVGDRFPTGSQEEAVVTVPSPPVGNSFIFQAPCASSFDIPETETFTVLLRDYEGCTTGPRPAMAILLQTYGSEVLGYLFDPDVALVPGAAVTMDGEWQPPFPFHVDVSGVPGEIHPLPQVAVARLVGSQIFHSMGLGAQGDTIEMIDGHAVGTLHHGMGGDGVLTHLRFMRPVPPYGTSYVVEYRDEAATSLVTDVSDDIVTIPTPLLVTRGELEPGGPLDVTGLEWSVDDGAAPDGVVLRFERAREETPGSSWTVVMPPAPGGLNQLVLPRLPSDLVPTWSEGEFTYINIDAVDSPASSYAEFRVDAVPQRDIRWTPDLGAGPAKTRIGSTQ